MQRKRCGTAGPGGGKIVYRDEAGFIVEGYTGGAGSFASYTAHYLEAADTTFTGVQWGDHGTAVDDISSFSSETNELGTRLGIGRKDTMILVVHLASDIEHAGETTNTAAQKCAAYNGGGKTDWFLPSLGELDKLHAQKSLFTATPSGYWWASSQASSSQSRYYAWTQLFSDGGTDGNAGMSMKSTITNSARAMRAF